MMPFFDAPLNVVRNTNVRRVLFLRLGAVGDLIVSTAALSETLSRFPNAEVWIAGPKLWTQLLLPSVWPKVTGILVLPSKSAMSGELWIPQNETWVKGKANQSLEEISKVCDASVNLRVESLRYARVFKQARLSVRLGTCPWWAQHYVTHNSPWLGRDPILHERDRLLHIARAPHIQWWPLPTVKRSRTRLKALQTDQFRTGLKAEKFKAVQPGESKDSVVREWHTRVLPQLKEPNLETAQKLTGHVSKQYLLINPTASRWEKAWPRVKFTELCARLKKQHPDLGLFLLGAPNETEWLQRVQADSGIPILQPATFFEAMDVIGHAKALVTNTSSLQFLANSMGTPAFVLMGRTFPARWGPLGAHDHYVCGTLPKKPIKDIFLEDFAGYDSLSVDQVEQELQNWLTRLLPQ